MLAVFLIASVGSIELVIANSLSAELPMRAAAPPDKTPWVMYAVTEFAPSAKSASAALQSVPPESTMSSTKIQSVSYTHLTLPTTPYV